MIPGKGKIYLESASVEYSKNIDVGNSGEEHDSEYEGDEHEGEDSDDAIECEQEGEHEGNNEGCVFSFSFSGDLLTITRRE